MKNLQGSGINNVVTEITHAQGDNIAVVLKPGQFTPEQLASLPRRVFSPNAPGSPKNMIQIIFENEDGSYVLGEMFRRWGT